MDRSDLDGKRIILMPAIAIPNGSMRMLVSVPPDESSTQNGPNGEKLVGMDHLAHRRCFSLNAPGTTKFTFARSKVQCAFA